MLVRICRLVRFRPIAKGFKFALPCPISAPDMIENVASMKAGRHAPRMNPPKLTIYNGVWEQNFSPDALAKRPQLAELVGRVVAEWSEVELQLAQLMCEAMEASAAPFAVAFEALGSSAAQVNVATKTIASRLEGDSLLEITVTVEITVITVITV